MPPNAVNFADIIVEEARDGNQRKYELLADVVWVRTTRLARRIFLPVTPVISLSTLCNCKFICIENSRHWCQDASFNEDHSRLRKGHIAQVLTPGRGHGMQRLVWC
jgi:hypothetical protein